MPDNVAVIGAGSWGTAVASLAAAHRPTTLWARDAALARVIDEERVNPKYLPGRQLHAGLAATDDLHRAIEGAGLVIMAVPSHGFRNVLTSLADHLPRGVPVLSLTKGLEQVGHRRMTEVVCEVVPDSPAGVLTGPNLASEVAEGQPTAAVVAMADPGAATWVQQLVIAPTFRVYTSTDVVGCEIAGALKNVLAIAAGVAEGLGFGDNTRAALITRGLAEMGRLGVALGGDRTTFAGLAGIGDLVATCTSTRSRNRTVGQALGAGRDLPSLLEEMHMVAEGVKTARPMVELADALGVEVPIASQVADLIEGRTTPARVVADLMDRPATVEFPDRVPATEDPSHAR